MKSKKGLSMAVALCAFFSVFSISILPVSATSDLYTDDKGNTAVISQTAVSGKYALTLHFANGYDYISGEIVDGMNTSNNSGSLNGRVKSLLLGAVGKYNANHATTLTAPALGYVAQFIDVNYSITELKVTSATGIFVSKYLFNTILPADGFVNLEKVDLSGMNITNSYLNTSSANKNIVNNNPVFANDSATSIIKFYTNQTNTTTISGDRAVIYQKLNTIILPSTLLILGSHTMRNIPALKEIVVPNGVATIGHYVFSGCTSLNSNSKARLFLDIKKNNAAVNIDLSGSNFSASELLTITKTDKLKTLNVSESNIDWSSGEGINV